MSTDKIVAVGAHLNWTLFFHALSFTIIMTLFPWEKIQGGKFIDLHTYITNFQANPAILQRAIDMDKSLESFIFLITREVAWDELVRFIAFVTGSFPIALASISFAMLLSISLIVVRYTGNPWNLLFLVNPLFIDLVYSQVRSALAFTLILIATVIIGTRSTAAKVSYISLITLACGIHTAGFIFALISVSSIFFQFTNLDMKVGPSGRNSDVRLDTISSVNGSPFDVPLLRLIYLMSILIVIVMVLSINRFEILNSLSDRRASYSTEASTFRFASGSFVIFILLLFGGIGFWKNRFSVSAALYNGVFVGLTIMGTYGSRFLAAAVPLFAISLIFLNPRIKILFILLYFSYTCGLFFYWIVK